MKRKVRILALLLCLTMLLGLFPATVFAEGDGTAAEAPGLLPEETAPAEEGGSPEEEAAGDDVLDVPSDEPEPADEPQNIPAEDLAVALVTDFGGVDDGSFNQMSFEAVRDYCEAAGIDYAAFCSEGFEDEARTAQIEAAIDRGFNVIVCPGYSFAGPVAGCAPAHPGVRFICLDLSADDLMGDGLEAIPGNVHLITYREEEAGFLAGYAAVKLGFTRLGFLGGMEIPAIKRYGYGFVQGANAAAQGLGRPVSLRYAYAGQFYGDPDLTAAMENWYETGTQAVFACGGGIYTSVAEAAAAHGGKIIGVDMDQAAAIDAEYGEGLTLSSAMKNLRAGIFADLDAILAESFPGGQEDRLGVVSEDPAENYVGLPRSTQFGEGFGVDGYMALVGRIARGELSISDDIDCAPGDYAAGIALDERGLDTPVPMPEGIAISAEHFPDEKFRLYVNAQFDSDGNGFLSDAERAAAFLIEVCGQGIADLKGIEYFSALGVLDCSKNRLTSLDLSGNPALEQLYCFGNQLAELDLRSCPTLLEAARGDGRVASWDPEVRLYGGDELNDYILAVDASTRLITEDAAPRFPGDANGDGRRDGADAIRIMKYLSGQRTEINLLNAEVTGDGEVDGRDFIRLMKFFAGQDVVLYGDEVQTQKSITLWTYPIGQWGDAETVQALIADFEAENPDIEVTVEYLSYADGDERVNIAIAAGTAPDLILEGPERLVAGWGADGAMADLSDMLDGNDRAEIYPAVLDACTDGSGALYEYPLCMTAHVMAVNLDAFRAVGADRYLDLETRTWTTEGFIQAVNAFTNAGYDSAAIVYCNGQGGDQGTRALVNNLYSGRFTDAAHTHYTADSAENIRALELLQGLAGVRFSPIVNGAGEIQQFRSGQIPMAFCWNIAQQIQSGGRTDGGDEIVCMAFPSDDGVAELQGGVWGFGAFDKGDSARLEAAKRFIRWFADGEGTPAAVEASGCFAVRGSAGDGAHDAEEIAILGDSAEAVDLSGLYADNEFMRDYARFMPMFGDYYQVTPGFQTARSAWWQMLQQIGDGAAVSEAAAAFTETANAAAGFQPESVCVWVSSASVDFTREAVDGFLAAHPEYAAYAVRIEPVNEADAVTAMLSDPTADGDLYVFPQDQLARLVNHGKLSTLPADKAAAAAAENDGGSVAASTLGGSAWAYPLTSDNGYFLYYDKSVVSDPSTLEQILSDCEAAGKTFNMELNSGWYQVAFFFGAGCTLVYSTDDNGRFVDCDVDYATEKGLGAFKAMIALTQSPAFINNSSVRSGVNIGAIVDGTWDSQAAQELFGDNYACAKLPTVRINGVDTQLSGFGGFKLLGVRPQGSAGRQAFCDELAAYLSSGEVQLARFNALGWGPSNLAAKADEAVRADEALAALGEQLAFCIPQGQYPGEYWGLTTSLGDSVIAGAYDDADDAALMAALRQLQSDLLALAGIALDSDDALAAEAWNYDPANYWDESAAKYDEVLGEFAEYYGQAMAADSVAERYALEAIAEAKLLGAGVMLPTTTQGGNYAISRVAPKTINSTLWGNDNDRFHDALIATEFIKASDRDALKAKWAELAGTGTYLEWAETYLIEHGYTLTDTYTLSYTNAPVTWDGLDTSRSSDTEAIVNTVDGLLEYDEENVQRPALAESYEVNSDFTVYTFHLRHGVTWFDSFRNAIGEVTADDFVDGMQHLLDARGGQERLAAEDGVKIVNAGAYLNGEITDFSQVGVKALDDYTLQYTLEEPCTWFTTLLGSNLFFPFCRSYYESQGDSYGSAPDHIAYCGPYLARYEGNDLVFEANPYYWNAGEVRIHTITWKFNDGSDNLKAYNDAKNGVLSGTGLNTAALEAAKADGLFDEFAYVSDTSSTTYLAFFNLMRNQFFNFNDPDVGVSQKTVGEARAYNAAMGNLHFRRALMCSVDRASYNAQSVGEDLKLNNLRNSYTPANYVSLPEGVTVDINGTPRFFAAGTYYGAIMQAQLDADGVAITVWDPAADGGIGSGDGFDGWYDPAYVQSELALAVEELAAEGLEISAEKPIVIESPYASNSQVRVNRANVVKQSIEDSFGGLVKVTLIDCGDTAGLLYAGYYPDYGYELNADFMDISGWGPDYGDPQSYLATMSFFGYMLKSCGIS